jgi:predicted transcriptional regulator of viral defense system
MKVTISKHGDVTLDITNGDGQAALDLIRALQADNSSEAITYDRQPYHRSLNVAHDEDVFDYVNQYAYGRTLDQVAVRFDMNKSTASGKLSRLHQSGRLAKLDRGRYAPLGSPKARSKPTKPLKLCNGNETNIWNYVCENDCEEGIPVQQIAKELGIVKVDSARASISKIKKLGYITRLPNGNVKMVER